MFWRFTSFSFLFNIAYVVISIILSLSGWLPELRPNVTFRPSVVAFHFPLTGFGFDMIKLLQPLSLFLWGWLDSGNCWISFLQGVECQFLSGRNISNWTLNHYSLIESEMYYFSSLFSGTTESLLISVGMPVRGRVRKGLGGWGAGCVR